MLSYAEVVKKNLNINNNKKWVMYASLDPLYPFMEEFDYLKEPVREIEPDLEKVGFIMNLQHKDRHDFLTCVIAGNVYKLPPDETYFSNFCKENPNVKTCSNNGKWWSKIKMGIESKRIRVYSYPTVIVFDEKQDDFETAYQLYQELAATILSFSPFFDKHYYEFDLDRPLVHLNVFPIFEINKPKTNKLKRTRLTIYSSFKSRYECDVVSLRVFLRKIYGLMGVNANLIDVVYPFSSNYKQHQNNKLLSSAPYPYIQITTPEDIHLHSVEMVKKYFFNASSAIFEKTDKVISLQNVMEVWSHDFKRIKDWNVVEEIYLADNRNFFLYGELDKVLEFFKKKFTDPECPRFRESLKILDLRGNCYFPTRKIINLFYQMCPNVKIIIDDFNNFHINEILKLEPIVKEKLVVIDSDVSILKKWMDKR
jgi:hypothetical protein